jgi:hypothetical protein
MLILQQYLTENAIDSGNGIIPRAKHMSPTFLPSAAATQVNHSCLVLLLAQPDPLHGFQPGLYYGEDHSISQKCAFLSMFKPQTVDAFASRDTTVWLILWEKRESLVED